MPEKLSKSDREQAIQEMREKQPQPEKPEVIHVYPVFKNEGSHELEGCKCWCGPKVEKTPEGGTIVIHNREQ